jgi:hypothetical protein
VARIATEQLVRTHARQLVSLLGAEITLYSDEALDNDHVSPNRIAATPL